MILVTVGTTGPFDELLQEVDRLVSEGFFNEPVLCQSGQSQYRMQSCQQFMARPFIVDLVEQSSFVISHGGAGTVLQLLMARKEFAAFPNPRLAADHQRKFLTAISQFADISWSIDVADLRALFTQRRALGPAQLRQALPRADDIIRRSLGLNV